MQQAKASQEIKELRDSAETVVLRQYTSIGQSTQDGTMSRPYTDSSPFKAEIKEYTQREIIGANRTGSETLIQPEDCKVKIAAKDIGLSVEIRMNDSIIRDDDSVWTVVDARLDKYEARWFLQIRRP